MILVKGGRSRNRFLARQFLFKRLFLITYINVVCYICKRLLTARVRLRRPLRCRVRREAPLELAQQFVGVAVPIVTPQLFDSLEPFFRGLIHEVSPQDGTA